jgi:MFS family permease
MFIERDQWHWSKLWIGTLGTIGAVASVIGCALYWKFGKRLNLNKWIFYSVLIGAVNTLLYLYFTPITDVVYDVINGVIGIFLQLIILDYMARKSTSGQEAMSFALLCSVVNITSTFNTLVGGYLFPIVGLKWLIIISATTSFMCLPILKKIKI